MKYYNSTSFINMIKTVHALISPSRKFIDNNIEYWLNANKISLNVKSTGKGGLNVMQYSEATTGGVL